MKALLAGLVAMLVTVVVAMNMKKYKKTGDDGEKEHDWKLILRDSAIVGVAVALVAGVAMYMMEGQAGGYNRMAGFF